jgi:hypothetical protein
MGVDSRRPPIFNLASETAVEILPKPSNHINKKQQLKLDVTSRF